MLVERIFRVAAYTRYAAVVVYHVGYRVVDYRAWPRPTSGFVRYCTVCKVLKSGGRGTTDRT